MACWVCQSPVQRKQWSTWCHWLNPEQLHFPHWGFTFLWFSWHTSLHSTFLMPASSYPPPNWLLLAPGLFFVLRAFRSWLLSFYSKLSAGESVWNDPFPWWGQGPDFSYPGLTIGTLYLAQWMLCNCSSAVPVASLGHRKGHKRLQ